MRLKVRAAGLTVVGLAALWCFYYLITREYFWNRSGSKITELPTPKCSEMTITLPSGGKIRIYDCNVQTAVVFLLRTSAFKGKYENQRLFPKLQYIGADESTNIVSIAYSGTIIYQGEVYSNTEIFRLISNILNKVCAQYNMPNVEKENIFFVNLTGEIVVDATQSFNLIEKVIVNGAHIEINTKFTYNNFGTQY